MAQSSISPAQIRTIAKDAYIYGYPMVQTYLTMYAFSIDNPDGSLTFYRKTFAARISSRTGYPPRTDRSMPSTASTCREKLS
jgi:hypothetical protein